MFTRNGVTYEFHHMGYPTTEPRPGERFSVQFGMHTSDTEGDLFPIQWHRFEPDSPLHPLIRTLAHVAFRVSDLDRAIENQTVVLGPYNPIEGFRVAIIESGGLPVEFFETALTDEELWRRARTGEKAAIY